MKKHIIWITALAFVTFSVIAKEDVPKAEKKSSASSMRLAAGCDPASASANLDINNVRARIMNGGDMWWDLVGTAKYEIPKVTEEGETRKTSLFAGALWIGGYDDGNTLRAAAMTYRQGESWDFFPGPLDVNTASIDESECIKWDKIFQITREEIDQYIESNGAIMSDNIRDWPAHGDVGMGQAKYLAPFFDSDEDGQYDPYQGDYPDVKGDQTLWFVYNDKGNSHTETEALSIGLEIQTQAFAFATNDEINNMTFYQQKIVNRSKNKLSQVYFGQWADADLGYAYDDYVGCDSTRSLGICYNGDDFDEGVMGYGSNPPSIGIDFFQGPLADPFDGVDNDKDGDIDEEGEEIIMSKFVYYNNDWSLKGNPSEGIHFYYYLVGKFKNGQKMRYGGDAFNDVWEDRVINYMFPDDPRKPNPAWSEITAGNAPADRRFLQSSGPFTLKPGAVNFITVGVVWARATSGGNTGSYDLLIIADDKAQKLYNNNFKLLDGPDAPDLVIQELDRELVLSLENTYATEKYYDSIISETGSSIFYGFQGYQIYQLANSTVTTAELDQPDKARLVARVDIKDGVKQLVNRQYVPGLGIVPTEKVDDNGDLGIKHTFSVKTDAFASGEGDLVNYKSYYFLLIAYSNTNAPDEFEQYLAGRKNIIVSVGIPHKNDSEFDGTELHSSYGDGPEITRIEGTGNGGQFLELTEGSVNYILQNKFMANPVYEGGNGPVNVFVYDPIKIPNADFELRFIDSSLLPTPDDYFEELTYKGYWMLTNLTTGKSVISDAKYGKDYEQIFPEWGLSIKVDKVVGPSNDTLTDDNGYLDAQIEFEDISKSWLTGIPDSDPSTAMGSIPWPYNWIRSGKFENVAGTNNVAIDDAKNGDWVDPNEVYEKMIDGRIAPYGLAARNAKEGSYFSFGPAYLSSNYRDNNLNRLQSIDLVLTSDKSKWTKCIVIETSEDENLSQGNVKKHAIRDHFSWANTTDVDNNGDPVYSTSEKGRSWFPGYAISLETGERMNIIFGEDSYWKSDNGDDLLWNPTINFQNPAASHREIDKYIWGGKHYIYLMEARPDPRFTNSFTFNSVYDEGKSYMDFFNSNPSQFKQIYFWSQAMYVMMAQPYQKLTSLDQGLIPTETTIKIRIQKPYQTFKTSPTPENNNLPLYRFSTTEISMTNSQELGEDAMEKINIVPNPYYAFSSYEKNQLDNRVKIINLPKHCEISIYTLSGSLVRRVKKDETDDTHSLYYDWDLKNLAGIPVASGLYIIHINGYELGTKTLKWFGIMRPIDLDTF